MHRHFDVVSPDLRLLWALPGLVLLAAAIGLGLAMRETPLAVIGLLPVALASVIVFVALHRRRVDIADGKLDIVAGINRHRVRLSDLDLDNAAIVDLSERTELRPFWRTFGTGAPGLRAGHYRLRNRDKAFVLVTDTRRVLVLPERSGRTLLLSVERPQALLDALRGDAR